MKYLALVTMAVAVAMVQPAFAGTVVNAVAGEACRITDPGAFSCVWTDSDGQSTQAEVVTGLWAPHDGLFGGYLHVTEVPLGGWIEIGLPYSLTEFKYSTWADMLFTVGRITAQAVDRDHRAIGDVYYQTGFFDDVCWGFSCTPYGPIKLSALYLGGTTDYFSAPSQLTEREGVWVASMKWSFREDAPASSLYLSSRITVPEPAT